VTIANASPWTIPPQVLLPKRYPEISPMQKISPHQKWIPLESDPEILTKYVHTMGLSPKLGFHDVISISDPDLLSFLPRPVEALLLTFPVTNVYEDYRVNADKGKELYLGENPVDGDVMWFRQTIGNACGTMGVIHSVFNGNVPSYLRILSEIPVLLT